MYKIYQFRFLPTDRGDTNGQLIRFESMGLGIGMGLRVGVELEGYNIILYIVASVKISL